MVVAEMVCSAAVPRLIFVDAVLQESYAHFVSKAAVFITDDCLSAYFLVNGYQ